MVQLLQNLLNNALSYHEASPPDVRIKATCSVGEWVFSVADNGIGLAVRQRVIERHGGRLWLESATGNGSIFYFSIPDGFSAGA